jgi:hypothetical protein
MAAEPLSPRGLSCPDSDHGRVWSRGVPFRDAVPCSWVLGVMMLDLLDLESRIVLRPSGDVQNAAAFVEDAAEGLKCYLFCNAYFMQRIRQKTAEY